MKKLILLASLVLMVTLVAAQCGALVQPETAAPGQPEVVAVEQPNTPADPPEVRVMVGDETFEAPQYTGSESCQECHEAKYETFMESGHPYKLNKVVDSQPPEYPFSEVPNPPEGYTWDDITYVIGGYGWKARFIDKDG